MTENTYILKGLIHPQRALLTFPKPIVTEKIEYRPGIEIHAELNVVCNQVTIWIQTNGDWNLTTLRNIGSYLTRTACHIYSYTLGHGYSIEITQILCKELGIDLVFGVDVKEIKDRDLGGIILQRQKEILSLTANESGQYIVRCFKDLNQSLVDADDTAFHCFRALESLRQYCRVVYNIEPTTDKDKDKKTAEKSQWQKLTEITGFGKEYIDDIRRRAFEIRHGNNIHADEGDNLNILLKTWNVVDKFILYCLDNVGTETK